MIGDLKDDIMKTPPTNGNKTGCKFLNIGSTNQRLRGGGGIFSCTPKNEGQFILGRDESYNRGQAGINNN